MYYIDSYMCMLDVFIFILCIVFNIVYYLKIYDVNKLIIVMIKIVLFELE